MQHNHDIHELVFPGSLFQFGLRHCKTHKLKSRLQFLIKSLQIDEIVVCTIKASLEKCDHHDLVLQQSFLNQIMQLPIKFTVSGIFIIDRTFIANVTFCSVK